MAVPWPLQGISLRYRVRLKCLMTSRAGDEGLKHCDFQCCESCLTNESGDYICCNAGEELCDGPGSDSDYCCPPGKPVPSLRKCFSPPRPQPCSLVNAGVGFAPGPVMDANA